MIFDPNKTRNGTGKILSFLLRTTYDSQRPMGNVAQRELQEAIKAWLVGLDAEVAPVIPRSIQWIDRALEDDEDFGTSRSFHRFILHWARAIGIWMVDGVNDVERWEQVTKLSEESSREPNVFLPNTLSTLYLDDYMAFCFQSKQYEIGVNAFEKCYGRRVVQGKSPQPRDIGYALCLASLQGQPSESAFDAGRRMLRAKLEGEWLGLGQAIRAATWLKIVHWHRDNSLTPLQTVLLAYEDMPHVPRPEFLTELGTTQN